MEELCRICGKPTNLDAFEPSFEIPKIMKKYNLCYSCAFWTYRISLDLSYKKDSHIIPLIISGIHYSLDRNYAIIGVSSSNGLNWTQISNMQHILMFDGHLYATNNLWYQGKIPKHFASNEDLQDNAMFISPYLYQELSQLKEFIQTGLIPAKIIKILREN